MMATTPEQWAAQDEAFSKQYDAEQAQKAQQEATPQEPPHPLTAFANWATSLPERVSTSILDTATSAERWMVNKGADALDATGNSTAGHAMRDVAVGATKGAVATMDTAHSALVGAARNIRLYPGDTGAPPGALDPTAPIWDHAKQTIQDFTDAVKVKDPTIGDNMLQFAAQVAPSYAAASRMLSSLHGVANALVSGAAADATALEPNAPRFADTLRMLQQTEGKIAKALQAAGPYGLNAYINYLASDKSETEAQGHFKNALDGLLPNFLGTELLHAAGVTVKQGVSGIRYMVDNGVGSTSGMVPPPALQRGGPAAAPSAARPAPRQITHEVEDGEHRLTSASGGYTHGQDVGRDIEVSTSFTPATARRQGEGTSRLETLARAAHDRGGVLRSGTTVSAAQASNYAQLEKRGYDVHRNAEATRNPETQGWLSGDPKLPVFVVRPRRSAAVGE